MRENDNCYICMRISPKMIFSYTHKVWKDNKVAHSIGVEVAKKLREIYMKNPPALCGKRPKAILAGLIYLISHKQKHPITQFELSEKLNVSMVTIKNSKIRLARIDPELKEIEPHER